MADQRTGIVAGPSWLEELASATPEPAKKPRRSRTTRLPPEDTEHDGKVIEGRRNTHLYRAACAMRGEGYDEDAVLEKLLIANAERCRPPLEEGEVEGIAASAAKYPPNEEADDDGDEYDDKGRLYIDARLADLPVLTALALEALGRLNKREPQIFRFGCRLVRLIDGKIEPLNPYALRGVLARAAHWRRRKRASDGDSEWVDDLPPMHVINDILNLPRLTLPALKAIVKVARIVAPGRIVSEHGFDSGSGLYHVGLPYQLDPYVGAPEDKHVRYALGLIFDDVLVDFPFVSEADKAHCVALLITLVARGLIDGPVPLYLFEKPTPGTGASLLVSALTIIATGEAARESTWPREEAEVKKLITSMLSQGSQVVLFDNVVRLVSQHLAAALTSGTWEDRPFGQNERTVSLPNEAVWIATANNPMLSNEIVRRTVRVRLDAGVERPWERKPKDFKHPDIVGWVKHSNHTLRQAVLCLVMSWINAGRPPYTGKVLGSFEAWSSVVGGVLEHVGVPGLLGNTDDFYEDSDSEWAAWRDFVVAWHKRHGVRRVGVVELLPLGLEVLDLDEGSPRGQSTMMGKRLTAMRDRVFAGYRITKAGTKQRAQLWKLESVGR